ncbi:MAG TPA: sigma-70 family RNA polymerase sigma factor [Dongiaceae bacterium]|nr:sigma-70 family RNA polymerase sigma factor [Dongiaceae bacterium]
MTVRNDRSIFEETGPFLKGLAYRILGSWADAEDAVQDTFLKWQKVDQGGIENPASWLTTVCARRCIDLLRSAQRTRVDYVGPWLPEPIHTAAAETPETGMTLASSLATAFLLLLERLTPKERTAYLFHEIFEMPYPAIAAMLEIQESTCRKLVSRARANIGRQKIRHVTPAERQEELLSAFESAIAGNDMQHFATLLSDDIELCADSGGKVPDVLHPLRGKADVLDFIHRILQPHWRAYRRIPREINGGRGFVLWQGEMVAVAVSFAYDEAGQATNIFIMRNPDKLRRLSGAAISQIGDAASASP